MRLIQIASRMQSHHLPRGQGGMSISQGLEWIVINEVQMVPKLLDIAHDEISKGAAKFALNGLSARKLKRGGANLLGGIAFSSDQGRYWCKRKDGQILF